MQRKGNQKDEWSRGNGPKQVTQTLSGKEDQKSKAYDSIFASDSNLLSDPWEEDYNDTNGTHSNGGHTGLHAWRNDAGSHRKIIDGQN